MADQTEPKLENVFLKCLSVTFGNIGYQFRSGTAWNVAVNVLMICLGISGLYVYDPFRGSNYGHLQVTFFHQLLVGNYRYILPYFYLMIVGSYLLNGRRLMRQLDLIGRYPYRYYRWHGPVAIIYLIISFFFSHVHGLTVLINAPWHQKPMDLWAYGGSFFWDVQLHLFFHLVIFYQGCLLEFLRITEENLRFIEKFGPESIDLKASIVKNMCRMAAVSRETNRILSSHILLTTICTAFNLTLIICAIYMFNTFRIFILWIPLGNIVAFFYLVAFCNHQIHRQMYDIRRTLLAPYWKRITIVDRRFNKKEENNNLMKQFDPIRYFELMQTFQNDFLLHVFELWTVDFGHLFQIVLLILGNAVFIVQTSQTS